MGMQAGLALESRLEEIARARHWVSAHARAAGFGDREVRNLGLAISEACANIIRHAYHGEDGHPIELHLAVDDTKLELRIRDHGAKFDQQAYQPPDLEQPQEGGYGVFIIRSLMDEVEYDTSGTAGTTLRLVKYRSHPTPRR
jgi:serine/threonine-protein kinase RsbW